MSTQSNKFPATIPIDITFFNAESVSPSKLNNIFNYIKNATYSIEMFLGNGIDYNTTMAAHKKVIGNLSNAIGQVAGAIYKPYNRIDYMYAIYKKFCSTYGNVGNKKYNNFENANYDSEGDSLIIIDSVNIPIMRSFKNDVVVGIHYTVKTDVTDISDDITCILYATEIDSPNGDSEEDTEVFIVADTSMEMDYEEEIPHNASIILPANTFIKYIKFTNKNSNIYRYKVYSIYLTEILEEEEEDKLKELDIPFTSQIQCVGKQYYANMQVQGGNFVPLNQFYAIGFDHPSYITCMKPCKWSKESYNNLGVSCNKSTSEGVCIGNTYDIYIDNGDDLEEKTGIPVCAGTYRAQSSQYLIKEDLLPTDGSGTQLQYNSSCNGTENPQFLTMQSPLSIYKNKFGTFKYHPFSLTTQTDAQSMAQGRVMVYDALADDGNHVIWDAKSVSTLRSDIIRVISSKITSGNHKKYLILSGDIGIADMNLTMANETNNKIEKHVAVYSD